MKKIYFTLITLLFCSTTIYAQDPCTSITSISCGNNVTFNTTSGDGNANYPLNVGGCSGSSAIGGKERIFSFTPSQEGTYEIEVMSASGGYVQYMWKQASLGCDNSGWNCIDRANTAGSIGAVNFAANATYFILVNAEPTTVVTHVFRIKCVNVVCNQIVQLSCGTSTTFGPVIGYGNPDYSLNVALCSGSSAQGGKEQIYSFTPTQSGTFEIEVLSASGGYVQYMWKQASLGCDSSGWNCIDRTNSIGSVGAVNFTANTTYYIVTNAETVSSLTHVFRIKCAKIVCNDILPISCGTLTTVGPLVGYGDPEYDLNVALCSGSSAQGGKEQIYSFTPTQSGTYEFEVTSVAGGFAQYMWKQASLGCDSSGWNCIERTNSTGSIGAVNFAANETYFILVNSETINSLTHIFRIKCAVVVCNDIVPISCGSSITLGPLVGYGNPDYDLNVGLCSGSSAQGGKEQIYILPASSSAYQIQVTAASGGFMQYMWKPVSLGCNSAGWNCLERRNTTGTLSATIPPSNTPIYLLVNSETINSNTVVFQVSCTLGIEDLQYDNNIALFPNPTNSLINLQLQNDLMISKVAIIDLSGKKIIEHNYDIKQINVESLASGIYIIEVYTENKKFRSKFIRE